MGKFYLQTNQVDEDSQQHVLYELHATTNISVSLPSTLTTYPTELGDDVTDNVVVKNQKVSLSGVLTDVSQAGSTVFGSIGRFLSQRDREVNQIKSVEDYIKELQLRIQKKEAFDFHHGENQEVKKCIITNFTYSKTNELGGEAWMVSLSLTQVRVADRAKFVNEPTADWKLLTEKKTQAGAGKNGTSESQEEGVNRGFSGFGFSDTAK